MCCFTGHRNQKLPWGFDEFGERFDKMKSETEKQIDKAMMAGYTTFVCGMALGFDMLCAEIVLNRKNKKENKGKEIKLMCVIPCENQDKFWNDMQRRRYRYILSCADDIYCISKNYTAYCIDKRNRYMVDKSSLVIALFNGCEGGTKNTLDYARRKGKDVVVIEP